MSRGLRLAFLRAVRWLARPWIGAGLVALVAWLGCVVTGARAGLPSPVVHDEFSYLLAADTFAHGRLANPPHPMGEHFESFHVLQRPTYSSMYPPAQGLVLAAGQVLGGEPAYGTWALAGVLAAATLWALRAWVPGRWALLGAFLVVARTGFGSYWAQSYWGGYAAATGGALLVGGLRRVVGRPRAADGVLAGLGAVLLANSRPYEGLVLALGGALLVVAWLGRRDGAARRQVAIRGLLPMGAVLLCGLAWTAVHDRAVTGSPWRLPHRVHAEQYVSMPFFVWQRPGPPRAYSHPDLEAFHRRIEPGFAARPDDYPGEAVRRLRELARFFLGRPLFAVGLGLLFSWRRRGAIAALGWTAWALLGHFATAPFFVHYAAPMTVLVALLFAFGARGWSAVRLGRLRSRAIVSVVALAFLASSALGSVASAEAAARAKALVVGGRRPAVARRLESRGGRHLVIVRYGPHHSLHYEWVYNAADIDGSPVVWAREMGEAKDRELLEYFRDRTAWRLTVDRDDEEPTLEPLVR